MWSATVLCRKWRTPATLRRGTSAFRRAAPGSSSKRIADVPGDAHDLVNGVFGFAGNAFNAGLFALKLVRAKVVMISSLSFVKLVQGFFGHGQVPGNVVHRYAFAAVPHE
jgi:hypothetical protein